MLMQRWCPVQLLSALDCRQCQHSIGAPYSSTVLLTAGYVKCPAVLMLADNVAAEQTIKLAKEGKPGNAFQRNIEELDEI